MLGDYTRKARKIPQLRCVHVCECRHKSLAHFFTTYIFFLGGLMIIIIIVADLFRVITTNALTYPLHEYPYKLS